MAYSVFIKRTSTFTNPFGLTDLGSFINPTYADVDNDGDLDIFAGNGGNLSFLENIGTASNPQFAGAVLNPFGLKNLGSSAKPFFGDLDNDGDLDLLVGKADGNIEFFLNNGSAQNPNYSLSTINPFGLTDTGSFVAPTMADIDGDGDLDVFVGSSVVAFFQNTGTATNPQFAAAVNNPFGLQNVGVSVNPIFIDIDQDGDLDGLFNNNSGVFTLFENTGTATNPKFAAPVQNPLGLSDVGNNGFHTVGDLNGDGNLDVLSANSTGTFNFFEGFSFSTHPVFVVGGNFADIGVSAAPVFADLDGDGDQDGLFGSNDGTLRFFQNIGTAEAPVFAVPVQNPFGLTDVGNNSTPALVDIDNDGDLDVFSGNSTGNITFFQNTGTASNPQFAAAVINPFGLTDTGNFVNPVFVDHDNDGDADLFIGDEDGNIKFLQNTGTASVPNFAAPLVNPFGFSDVGAGNSPTFGDIDQDGDFDALISESTGQIKLFINVGDAETMDLAESEINPFGLVDVGSFVNVNLADVDNDGDLDAFIGANDGITRSFINQSAPSFDTLANPVASGNEDSTITITFADVLAQADATDKNGQVVAFVVQTLTSGNLLLGESLETATAFAAGSNDTFTGDTKAFWTPNANANGVLPAFTVLAKDNEKLLSTTPITALVTVNPVNDAPTGNVLITGTAKQGETLTASQTLADVDGLGPVSFQWLVNGAAIQGATNDTFTLSQAEVGKRISVIASYTDGAGTAESKTSAATLRVANVNDLPQGNVLISGQAKQGATLTASNTLTDLDGLGVISYQWQANGVNIVGATEDSFTLTQAEVGKKIRVVASYTDGFGAKESKNSGQTGNVANVNDAPTGSVNISGFAQQNETLNLSNTLADLDGLGDFTVQWQANGVTIAGANGTNLALTQAEVGKTITAIISYTDGFGQAESVASAPTAPVANVNDLPTGSVTISGETKVGQTLTVTNNLADLDGLGLISLQWFANGTEIAGATGTTFKPTRAEIGKTLTVLASYTDGQGTDEAVASAATAPIVSNDSIDGTGGDDLLLGDVGNNILNGLGGNDLLDGDAGNDKLNGGDGNDLLNGGAGNDVLSGGKGTDLLSGGAGKDSLTGGAGNDVLAGGSGADIFILNTSLTANVDTIADFSVADDTIRLENQIYTSLTKTGVLPIGQFVIGTAALDSNDNITYNNITGALFYDADGNGTTEPVQIAVLGAALALTNADFVVI